MSEQEKRLPLGDFERKEKNAMSFGELLEKITFLPGLNESDFRNYFKTIGVNPDQYHFYINNQDKLESDLDLTLKENQISYVVTSDIPITLVSNDGRKKQENLWFTLRPRSELDFVDPSDSYIIYLFKPLDGDYYDDMGFGDFHGARVIFPKAERNLSN